MALSDIRAYLAQQLATITSPGIILQYKPIATRPEAILQVFGGDQEIKTWAISLYRDTGSGTPTVEDQLTNREVLRKHTITIGLYRSVIDPAVTEAEVEALSEAAMAVFRPVIRLGPPENVQQSFPMQRVGVQHVMLGGTLLTHLWEHTLEVWERISNVGL